MKKFSFPLIVLLSITAMSSCRNKQAEVNPLLAPWDTPYEVPPFDKIEIRHYKPAVEQAIVRHQKEIDSIASNPAAPDFENTIAALDRSGKRSTGSTRPSRWSPQPTTTRRCSRPIWKYRRR